MANGQILMSLGFLLGPSFEITMRSGVHYLLNLHPAFVPTLIKINKTQQRTLVGQGEFLFSSYAWNFLICLIPSAILETGNELKITKPSYWYEQQYTTYMQLFELQLCDGRLRV
jgi:hypothetical protein